LKKKQQLTPLHGGEEEENNCCHRVSSPLPPAPSKLPNNSRTTARGKSTGRKKKKRGEEEDTGGRRKTQGERHRKSRRAEGREKERQHGGAEDKTPPSSSPLHNQNEGKNRGSEEASIIFNFSFLQSQRTSRESQQRHRLFLLQNQLPTPPPSFLSSSSFSHTPRHYCGKPLYTEEKNQTEAKEEGKQRRVHLHKEEEILQKKQLLTLSFSATATVRTTRRPRRLPLHRHQHHWECSPSSSTSLLPPGLFLLLVAVHAPFPCISLFVKYNSLVTVLVHSNQSMLVLGWNPSLAHAAGLSPAL
jgi:hypothetical protein